MRELFPKRVGARACFHTASRARTRDAESTQVNLTDLRGGGGVLPVSRGEFGFYGFLGGIGCLWRDLDLAYRVVGSVRGGPILFFRI